MADPLPLLAELIADAIVGKLTQPMSESAIAQTQILRQLLLHKFQQDSEAANTLTAIEQGFSPALDQLVEQLKSVIQQDAQFAAQAKAIAETIYPAKL